MRPCQQCGEPLQNNQRECPKCGFTVESPRRPGQDPPMHHENMPTESDRHDFALVMYKLIQTAAFGVVFGALGAFFGYVFFGMVGMTLGALLGAAVALFALLSELS